MCCKRTVFGPLARARKPRAVLNLQFKSKKRLEGRIRPGYRIPCNVQHFGLQCCRWFDKEKGFGKILQEAQPAHEATGTLSGCVSGHQTALEKLYPSHEYCMWVLHVAEAAGGPLAGDRGKSRLCAGFP